MPRRGAGSPRDPHRRRRSTGGKRPDPRAARLAGAGDVAGARARILARGAGDRRSRGRCGSSWWGAVRFHRSRIAGWFPPVGSPVFGCLGRLGCLFLILLLGAAAWLTRGRWQARSRPCGPLNGARSATPAPTRRAMRWFAARRDRPAFVELSATELASLLAASVGPPPASWTACKRRSMDRIGCGEHPAGRHSSTPWTVVRVHEHAERIEMSGTIDVLRPGLGQFRLSSAGGRLSLPQAAIPKLLAHWQRRGRTGGCQRDCLRDPGAHRRRARGARARDAL